MIKNITGVGFLLKTLQGTFLFQERDKHIARNPGMIAPFGGGIDKDESVVACALRELDEELELKVTEQQLQDIGCFESHFSPNTYIQMFLIEEVNLKDIVLHEGKQIVEFPLEVALQHSKVTNFTKEVLQKLAA